jgi:uncharacterized repeat protein (TIGR01451 family)
MRAVWLIALSVFLLVCGSAEAKKRKPSGLTISVADATVKEGGKAGFAVTLSKKSKRAVVVDFATTDGTATAPGDYTAHRGTLVIRPKKARATIVVNTVNDAISEPDEHFTLKLKKPLGGKLKRAKATATIVDDDAATQTTTTTTTTTETPATGADIALTGSRSPATYRGGPPLLYTFTVTNNGPQAADGVVVTDSLPVGSTLSVAWTTPSCTAASGTATCQLGSLAAGASATVTVAPQLAPPTTPQNVSTSALASSATTDPAPGNASYADAFVMPAGNVTLGTSDVSMPRDGTTERKQETVIGDFVTDAYRSAAGTQLAVLEGGDIRAAMTCNVSTATGYCPSTSGPPYSITRGAIVTALPFNNRVVRVSISGAELWTMLANSIASTPTPHYKFLQVSGFCFVYGVGSHTIQAVQLMSGGTCSGAAIAADSTQYTIATNDFIAGGAFGYPNLSSRATTLGFDTDAVTDYLISATPLTAPALIRISQTMS